jgi:hypothetical protein
MSTRQWFNWYLYCLQVYYLSRLYVHSRYDYSATWSSSANVPMRLLYHQRSTKYIGR